MHMQKFGISATEQLFNAPKTEYTKQLIAAS
jgi:ABC-type microcin C transport system duplicated ATPase subunit YejF